MMVTCEEMPIFFIDRWATDADRYIQGRGKPEGKEIALRKVERKEIISCLTPLKK